MRPYYEDDYVRLYHGDCRHVLPKLGHPVALVVTDAPYGIRYRSNRRAQKHEAITGDDALPLDVFSMIDVLDGGAQYWFCRESDIGAFNRCAFEAGWKPRRALVWDKGIWAAGDLEGDWGVQCETIAWAAKGRHILRGARPSNLIRVARVRTDDHPTEKPESLLERIITVSSDPAQVVLDPFAGSGATLVAAKRMGRAAIGIEINSEFCAVAAERLRQGSLAEMFA